MDETKPPSIVTPGETKPDLKTWSSEVGMPLAKLAGVVFIAIVLLLVIGLDKLLKGEVWNERTVIALAIILTFCMAVFVNLKEETMRTLNGIALLVIGFYFGSSKLENTTAVKPGQTPAVEVESATQKPKDNTTVSPKATPLASPPPRSTPSPQ